MKHKHHIVPKYLGGDDSPINIIELSPEEHALAHKKLWEEYGNWQDHLAWKGLSGLISGDECQRQAIIEGSKKGNLTTNSKYPKGTRKNWNRGQQNPVGKSGSKNAYSKTYVMQTPRGTEIVSCLSSFCMQEGIKYNSFHKTVIERKRNWNGYYLIEIVGLTNIRG